MEKTDSAQLAYKKVLRYDDLDSVEANLKHEASRELAYIAYAEKSINRRCRIPKTAEKNIGTNIFAEMRTSKMTSVQEHLKAVAIWPWMK